MEQSNAVDTKHLLQAWRTGDNDARDALFKLLYAELRQVSAALLRAESNNSLSTGDLVNEAALKLIRLDKIEWADKSHFLALSARAMRQILIDHAQKEDRQAPPSQSHARDTGRRCGAATGYRRS